MQRAVSACHVGAKLLTAKKQLLRMSDVALMMHRQFRSLLSASESMTLDPFVTCDLVCKLQMHMKTKRRIDNMPSM